MLFRFAAMAGLVTTRYGACVLFVKKFQGHNSFFTLLQPIPNQNKDSLPVFSHVVPA